MKFKFLENIVGSFDWVSGDIAIDLGTANTLIWLSGRGLIINEPSINAKSTQTGKVLAVGDKAKEMLGKTHQGIETIRPLRDGVIDDVDEPVAAAIGIGLDISKPLGNIIVDIGGGTTEVAVISLNGVVTKKAIRVAGDEMDEAIIHWFRNEHKLEIGEQTAEEIKISVGSAMRVRSKNIVVKGRDLVSGIPKTLEVRSDEVRQALKDPVTRIVEVIKQALEDTPPQLSADIVERGIILAGGGSLLKGIDQVLREKTGVPVNVADEPHLSVVKGCGIIIENLEKYQNVINRNI